MSLKGIGAKTLLLSQRKDPMQKPIAGRIGLRLLRPCCLKIDRRRHFEKALERQNKEDERFGSVMRTQNEGVIEVRSQNQLDILNEKFKNALLIVFLYSRSCGSCKKVLENYRRLHDAFRAENARVVFVKHDVHDDFDHLTDIACMYSVHSVPSFLFLSDGALIKKIQFRDSRQAVEDIPRQIDQDKTQLNNAIRRILFKVAPSAAH